MSGIDYLPIVATVDNAAILPVNGREITAINCMPHIVRLTLSGGIIGIPNPMREDPKTGRMVVDERRVVRVLEREVNCKSPIPGFPGISILMEGMSHDLPRVKDTIYLVSKVAALRIAEIGPWRDDVWFPASPQRDPDNPREILGNAALGSPWGHQFG